jgi:hypothetical protein
MNSARLAAEKLRDLIEAADAAESEFEKAAVFSAVTLLTQFLDAEAEMKNPNWCENVGRARHDICAMVGYEVVHHLGKSQHKSWAIASVKFLCDKFGE